MLSHSLNEIIRATVSLPDHVAVACRAYDQNPEAIAALGRLRDALAAVDDAILGRLALPPTLIEVDVSSRPH